MGSRVLTPLLVALGLTAALATAQQASAAEMVTEARVRAAFDEARTAVEETLDVRLEPAVELRFVDAGELVESLVAENLPALLRQAPDRDAAEREARAFAEATAPLLIAKYAWQARAIVVVLDTWNGQAQALGRPELGGDEMLRAVLVHELVHAIDDVEHGLEALFAKIDSRDTAAGVNAVLEGHAQHVARAVCAARGWTKGFQDFTDAIGALPEQPGIDEGTLLFQRIASAGERTAYHDGERFIAALERAGGRDAIARAFRDPPKDGQTVFHPEWFLDPSSRPKSTYDLDAGIDLFAARFDDATWNASRSSLQPAQLQASLGLLPAETSKRIVESLRGSSVIVLQPRADPASKFVAAIVIEFDAEESALFFVEAARGLSRIKDETMKEGAIRISASSLSDLATGGAHGFILHKRMHNGPLAFDVSGSEVARGRLVVETVFSAEPIEDGEHEQLVLAMLEALEKRPDER